MSTSETFWTRFDGILFGSGVTLTLTGHPVGGIIMVATSLATVIIGTFVVPIPNESRNRWKETP